MVRHEKSHYQMQNTSFSAIHPVGWLILIIGTVMAVIMMVCAGNFILGFLYFFGIMFLTIIMSAIVHVIFSNDNNSDSIDELYTEETQTIQSHYSIDTANNIVSLIH
jgi:hypothetical protein